MASAVFGGASVPGSFEMSIKWLFYYKTLSDGGELSSRTQIQVQPFFRREASSLVVALFTEAVVCAPEL